jgi:hypothetical protein
MKSFFKCNNKNCGSFDSSRCIHDGIELNEKGQCNRIPEVLLPDELPEGSIPIGGGLVAVPVKKNGRKKESAK